MVADGLMKGLTGEKHMQFISMLSLKPQMSGVLEFDVDLLTFSFQLFIYLHVTLVMLSGCSLHPLSLYVVFRFLPFYIYTYWCLDVLFH